jgi:hypothetical protein
MINKRVREVNVYSDDNLQYFGISSCGDMVWLESDEGDRNNKSIASQIVIPFSDKEQLISDVKILSDITTGYAVGIGYKQQTSFRLIDNYTLWVGTRSFIISFDIGFARISFQDVFKQFLNELTKEQQ